ncbi:hypothetical protein JB92DRAFT_2829515 [Gautieria morchelliformis]|nr:hypothetical protein JB92DRAFT_2829515 [Gautieria morchelliformis]
MADAVIAPVPVLLVLSPEVVWCSTRCDMAVRFAKLHLYAESARFGRPLVIPQVGTRAITGARNDGSSRKGNQWTHSAPNSEYRSITGMAASRQDHEEEAQEDLARAENGWLGGYAGWGAGTAGEEGRRLIKTICSARLARDGEYVRGGGGVRVGRMGSTRTGGNACWRVGSNETSRRRAGWLVGFGNSTASRDFLVFPHLSLGQCYPYVDQNVNSRIWRMVEHFKYQVSTSPRASLQVCVERKLFTLNTMAEYLRLTPGGLG